MRRSLPLAVQNQAGTFDHYWLDGVSTLSPDSLSIALQAAAMQSDALELNGVAFAAHTTDSLSKHSHGLLLEQPTPTDDWHRDLYLRVLSGPNTGFTVRLSDIDDLALQLEDDHIDATATLINAGGQIVLMEGKNHTYIELGVPRPLGNSVISVDTECVPTRPQSPVHALRLPEHSSVPNRNYRYYLALALGPLLIGAVLIAFTKMWFFLLFGVLSLFGGLIPYTQGRRAWLDFRNDLRERWQRACDLQWQIFGPPNTNKVRHDPTGNLHICLGYGSQHPPLDHPRLPTALQPPLASLQPVGVTLNHHPPKTLHDSHERSSPHGLRPAATLQIEATASQHRSLVQQLLLQVLPQLGNRTCWVRGSSSVFEDPNIQVWLRFFPNLRIIRSATDSPDFAAGDVVITQGIATANERLDIELIRINITDAPSASGQPSWHLDAHQHSLRFDHDHGHRAHLTHIAMTGNAQFLSQLQKLVRQPSNAGADQLSMEQLPSSSESCSHTLLACLGSEGHGAAEDRYHLDLVTDGPHMLIVGTTGSGKSVLLRRLTTEWVSRYSADELNVVLVDFKGGATFSPFISLPHTVGHLTDLDGENTPRLLVAIRTELKHRERLFAEVGAEDFTHFRTQNSKPLPRIAVMIDEFAVFASDRPEALDELMHLATIGRSLGFHLVLATQRTGGHLSLGLRSNLSVKICLRVLNENESHELIGTAKAAQLRPDQPGYAYVHTSGAPARAFRVIPHRGHSTPRIRGLTTAPKTSADADATELRTLLTTLTNNAAATSPDHPRSGGAFLLPPMGPIQPHPEQRVLARLDLPENKSQPWFGLRTVAGSELSTNSIALIGEPCSYLVERLTGCPAQAENTVLLAATSTEKIRYTLAGFVDLNDAPDGTEIMATLRQEISQLSGREERILIIEDLARWLSLCEQYRLYDAEPLIADLIRLSKEPRNRFHVILHIDAAHSHHQLINACQHRLYLPRGVPDQQRLLWPRNVSYTEGIGRGQLFGANLPEEGALCQLAAPPTRPQQPQPRLLKHRWAALPEVVGARPHRFPREQLFLGLHGVDHRPLHHHATGLMAIIGPASSGKSSLCRLIAAQQPDALIFDDLHSCTHTELMEIQGELARDEDRLILLATTPDQLRRPQLSFLTGHLHHGSHVLLRPSMPAHFDPFLLTPMPMTALPPGRGVFIQDGTTTVFQAAFLTEDVRPEHTPQSPTRRSLRATARSG